MKFRVGVSVHKTLHRTIEASNPETAVLRALKSIAGANNRRGIEGTGNVLYVQTDDGNNVAWSVTTVRADWEDGR